MKKSVLICLLFVMTIAKSFATDIVVEEFGITPAYPTITDAVAAASNGDRIIIKNRAGNIPWIENINITKSLQFLPFDNDTFFVAQGTWTITLGAGQTVTIIGMKNTLGGVQATSSTGGAKTAQINIHGSYFISGNIYISSSSYELNATHNQLDAGYIYTSFGSICGNDVTTSSSYPIQVYNNSGTALNDTVFIIGNKVNSTATGYSAIYVSDIISRYHIKNNFVKSRYMGIMTGNTCNGTNLIYNNTILLNNTSSSVYGIDVYQVGTGDILEIMNNVIDFVSTTSSMTGINNDGGNTGTVNVYFNHVDVAANYPISSGFSFSGNNTTSQSLTLANDGHIQAGSAAINGGNPAAPFYDLDLSAGDAGAYGGSYTLDNYFPLFAGSSRVYLNTYPFNVRLGNTLNIKGNSFDR
jgi:hypothetical protein